jgi:autonomous glycyl radical cofactor GrcA
MWKKVLSSVSKIKDNKSINDDNTITNNPEQNFLVKSIGDVGNQYLCEVCDYITSKKSSYDSHLSSKKHQKKVSENKNNLVCEICNYTTSIKNNYTKHLSSKKHKEKVSENFNSYVCEICDYDTTIKSNYDKHLSSKKHTKNSARILPNIYSCDICHYNTTTKYNYTKHLSSKTHLNKSQNDNKMYSSIMDELKNMMLEQNTKIIEEQAKQTNILREEQAKIIEEKTSKMTEEQTKMNQMITEIANKPTASSISNNTNISNNQHFNMNMFLNETCKDAMNLSDFMKNLTVTMEDMELTGQLGFVKGMTRIIVNNLNALDVCKRPIHCSDAKRETLYVKNNGVWEKETDDKQFTKELIRRVRHLSDIQLSKWRYLPKNKGYERYDHHKNTEFLTLVYEIHQFREEEIDKLIRNIIRHVVIDKSLYLK